MPEKFTSPPYADLPKIIYLFLQLLTIGTFTTLFLTTYLTFDPELFTQRNTILEKWTVYLLVTGVFNILLYGFFLKDDFSIANLPRGKISRFGFGTLPYLLFVLFLLLGGVLIFSRSNPKYLLFLAFLTGFYSVIRLIKSYTFLSDLPAWNHPTTAGSVSQGAAALGSVAAFCTFSQPAVQDIFSWLLVIILVFETLTIWSRFKFLSNTSPETRRAAEMMLGSHLALFGVRFIFGIAMPLVYLLWRLFLQELPIVPVVLMILVGELSERILFFITAFPVEPADPTGTPFSTQNEES